MRCRAESCTNDAVYKKLQLCKIHYDRRRYQGDENARPKYTRGFSDVEKLAHYREIPADPDACFGWSGRVSSHGYAQIWTGGRKGSFRAAHRVTYLIQHGELPGDLQVDHMCHNEDLSCIGGPTCLHRRCTNPAHLRVATRLDNVGAARRAERPGFLDRNVNARKTHCKWGHEFTPENIWMNKGARYCRACLKRRSQEAKERKKMSS